MYIDTKPFHRIIQFLHPFQVIGSFVVDLSFGRTGFDFLRAADHARWLFVVIQHRLYSTGAYLVILGDIYPTGGVHVGRFLDRVTVVCGKSTTLIYARSHRVCNRMI